MTWAQAQNDPASGILPFSTHSDGRYDSVDLASSAITIVIPLRSKTGKIPVSLALIGNSHAFNNLGSLQAYSTGTSNGNFTLAKRVGVNAAVLGVTGTYTPSFRACAGHSRELQWTNFSITDSTGASHGFGNQFIDQYGCDGATTKIWTSVDGSGYTLKVVANPPLSMTLWDKSGNMTAWASNTYPSSVTDADGVTASFNQTTGVFTDSLGTTLVTASYGSGTNGPDHYTYTDWNGNTESYTVNYTRYTVKTNFACSVEHDTTFNGLYLPTSITTPDNGTYTVKYEQTPGFGAGYVTGRIAEFDLPSGGKINYGYSDSTGNNGINCTSFVVPVLTRALFDNNGHVSNWKYVNTNSSSSPGNFTVTETDPAGDTITHNFSGGYQTDVQVKDVNLGILSTTVTCYNQNYTSQSACVSPSSVPVLPITQTDTYRYPNGSPSPSLVETKFDSYGNTIEVKHYDFGATIPPSGNPVSDTVVSYGQAWNGTSCGAYSPGTYIYDTPCYSHTMNSSGTDVAKTQITYSNNGHPVSTARWVSGSFWLTSTASYNSNGALATASDVNGAVSTYGYNGTGGCNSLLPTSVTVTGAGLPSGGLISSTQWNCNGGVITSTTDPNGQVTAEGYVSLQGTADPLWRVLSLTDPLNNVTSNTYSPGSTIPPTQESNLPFNNNTSAVDVITTFDGLARPIVKQTRQAPGSSSFDTISYTYDSNGRAATVSMPCVTTTVGQACPATPATTTSYDAAGRPISITDGGGGTTSYSYPANDVLQTVGPEHPSSRQMEYDGLGRLKSVCEVTSVTGSNPCGQASPQTGYLTSYSYDALGNLAVVTQNAAGSQQETRNYGYDGLSRLTSESNPETGGKTYTYDVDSTCGTYKGDKVKRTDAAGNTTCYSYDALHRMTSTTYSGTNATPNKYFVYDAATVNGVAMANATGRMAEAYTGSPSSKTTDLGFVYSPKGENIEIWESTPHSGGYYHPTAGSGYWANGALQTLWMSGLPTLSYGVDGEGRTWSVSANSGQNPVTATLYNGASQVKSVTFGSGDSDALTFDSNTGRMTQYQFNVNGSAQTGTLGWNGNGTLSSLGIVDPFNSGNAQNCAYGYDDLSRLASVGCGSAWAQSFTYDAFGNISKSNSSSWQPNYNTKNQYSSIPGFPNPGPTYDLNGDTLTDSFHTYTWDAEGHVTAIDSIGLTYDALGRQVEQNQSGTYFQIVYSPMGGKFAVMKGQTIQQAFVPLPGGTTAEYLSWGLSHYRHADWLGSERLESGTARNVIQDTAYAPFGEPYAQLSGGNGELSFTGQNKDTDWLNYDFTYREYDPRQSRWISPDPAGLDSQDPSDPQSWNLYGYVQNKPLSNIDSDGRDCLYFSTEGNLYVKSGDCISVHDNGIYVDGSVSSPTYNSDNGSWNYSYTAYDSGNIGRGTISGAPIPGPEPQMDNGAVSPGTLGLVGDVALFSGVEAPAWLGKFGASVWGTIVGKGIEEVGGAGVEEILLRAGSTVGPQGIKAASKEAAEQAAKDWVGAGARAIRAGRGSGDVVGEISADGSKVARFTSINKPNPYINLENKVTGGNLHVSW